jgi:hypothetical protein
MGYMVAYLFKTYNILAALMVNSDQIGLHLVSIAREQTWESKGAKHIKASRIKDKKHVTLVVSSFAWMDCSCHFKLFLQVSCIKHYPQIMKENSCASIIDEISPFVKFIGQPLRPQKDLFTNFCYHVYIHKLSN